MLQRVDFSSCRGWLTSLSLFVQGKTWQTGNATFEQQTLHTSMAGVDGSLVMVGEAVTTEAEELEMTHEKETFVLLDNVPQVCLSTMSVNDSSNHFVNILWIVQGERMLCAAHEIASYQMCFSHS